MKRVFAILMILMVALPMLGCDKEPELLDVEKEAANQGEDRGGGAIPTDGIDN